jgi:dTMP kinase
MERGKFIVLEGINGCGKGTQLSYLQEFLLNLDKSKLVFLTREPNELDDNGRMARELLKRGGDPYANGAEAVKYFALNRKTHNELIGHLLDRGVNVISDRYWHSNFAFQGAQGISLEDIAKLNEGYLVPDLTIIFNISAETADKRLSIRDGRNRRKFDANSDFLKKVSSIYRTLKTRLENLTYDGKVIFNDKSIKYIECEDKGYEKTPQEIKYEVEKLVSDLFNAE